MPSDLAQITFPHSDPGNVPIWTRHNGNQTFSIRPAISRGKIIGFPYGPIPRLLMHWLTTELLRTDSNTIYLGNSLSAFMRELGLDPVSGGKYGYRVRCQKQIQRFFRSVYTNEFSYEGQGKKGIDYHDMQIAPKGRLWWEFQGDYENVFDGHIELSQSAAEMFRTTPMPCDLRLLRAFKGSSLCLDYNDWLHYKTYIANKKGMPIKVPWRGLILQFGSKFGEGEIYTKDHVKNFKRRSKWAIDCVTQLCTYLDTRYYDGGVEICPSELPLTVMQLKRLSNKSKT